MQFANKQHASLRKSVARLTATGQLREERAILRQILGLEVTSELAIPRHPTDPKFLAQVTIVYFGSQNVAQFDSCAHVVHSFHGNGLNACRSLHAGNSGNTRRHAMMACPIYSASSSSSFAGMDLRTFGAS